MFLSQAHVKNLAFGKQKIIMRCPTQILILQLDSSIVFVMQTKVDNRKMGYCGSVGINIMSMSGIIAVKNPTLFDLVYP